MNFNCIRCYMPVKCYYLTITNYISVPIYFILQYDSQKGLITKTSSVLLKDACEKLSFTKNATNVAVNIINNVNQEVICNISLNTTRNYYFNVIQTSTGFKCIEK